MNRATRLLRPCLGGRLRQQQYRFASTSFGSASQTVPSTVKPSSEAEASDPQLAGLGYPIFDGASRQLRPAKSGWWDEQDRMNRDDVLAENDDIQTMWGPDIHPNFPGLQALQYLGVAAVVMAGVCSFIWFAQPDQYMYKRSYPYDGLKKEMLGTTDTEFAAARLPPAPSEDDE